MRLCSLTAREISPAVNRPHLVAKGHAMCGEDNERKAIQMDEWAKARHVHSALPTLFQRSPFAQANHTRPLPRAFRLVLKAMGYYEKRRGSRESELNARGTCKS